ncbi:MAG: two-component histidine kinase MprB [Actinomycetota bacterium]|jgi:two-component system sensor histidine kinase MprB
MSLRWRIALASAAVVSISVVVVGAMTYRATVDSLRGEIDRSIAAIDVRSVERILATGTGRPPVRSPLAGFDAQVVAADGTIVSSTFDEPLPVDVSHLGGTQSGRDSSRGRLETLTVGGDRYRVVTIGFDRGVVQIGRSLEGTDRVLGDLRIRIALWTLVTALLAVAAGWWSAHRVTGPLRRLTGAAAQVGSTGDLDVTVGDLGTDEVGRLGATFDSMISALRRSRAEQRRLVQDAGHELRTPLTSLRSNLDTLERFPDLPAEDRRAILADLRSETLELSELVDEIVQLASGEHADEPLEPLALRSLVSEVVDRFVRRTGRPIEIVGPEVDVIGRRGPLQRAVSCLVDNACKFDTGGSPVVVTVGTSVGRATVAVADRGPGIASDDLDRVFDRFHRAEAARSMPGSGLGLSIVREVAQRHGGDAWAAARTDGGAEVGFWVAALPPPTAEAGTATA